MTLRFFIFVEDLVMTYNLHAYSVRIEKIKMVSNMLDQDECACHNREAA